MSVIRSLLKDRSARTVVALTLLTLTSCPGPKKPTPEGPARTEYLTAFADCAVTSTTQFEAAATQLNVATQAWAQSPSAQTQADARAAFQVAMDAWQVLEVMGDGPAADRSVAGGQDLRNDIYSWPLVSRCGVEEVIVSKGYEAPDFGTLLINKRGLAALEYLMFYEGADTACAATSTIVSSGSWAALSAGERDSRKQAYAARAAGHVLEKATALKAAWDPASGNFHKTLTNPGSDNAVYPTTQKALNAVSDALFYVEGEVKDMKLAPPLALRDCSKDVCPELLESTYAKRSRRNIEQNFEGFRRLMFGCEANHEGKGFDELLLSLSAQDHVDRLRAADAQVTAALAAIAPAELDVTLTTDKPKVRALYDANKALTDLLKTEFSTVLDLELPMSLEGDND
jgi:predicted lipoprotein